MPLTPVRRVLYPVLYDDGEVRYDAPVWQLHQRGSYILCYRPGGWGSVVALGRVLKAVVVSWL